jgi:hypothetical protein
MDWINKKTKIPPKRPKPYKVLTMCVETHNEGNYKGEQKITIVQDWVFRNNENNFTHWFEIERLN